MEQPTTIEREKRGADLVQRMVRRFVAFVLARIYGVRGSLKPPLGGPHAGPLYLLRYRWWKAMNRLYHWSGLPDKWWAWRTSPNDQAQRPLADSDAGRKGNDGTT